MSHVPSEPEPPDAIIFTRGSEAPPRYHMRDQEAFIAKLPAYHVTAADRATLIPHRLAAFPATLWLPGAIDPEPLEGPDEWSQGWSWATGESLMLLLHRHAGLPGLHAVSPYPPGARCARLAGRPVAVTASAHDPDGSAGSAGAPPRYALTVDGYLDDRTRLWAELDAPTPEQLEKVLAALLTLRVDGDQHAAEHR